MRSAGGVPAQRQRQLVAGDAAAVILDHDAAHPARGKPHDDLGGARVQRVIDQFAHHGGWPLDHLAGRDLADQLVRQFADRPPLGAMRHHSDAPLAGQRGVAQEIAVDALGQRVHQARLKVEVLQQALLLGV